MKVKMRETYRIKYLSDNPDSEHFQQVLKESLALVMSYRFYFNPILSLKMDEIPLEEVNGLPYIHPREKHLWRLFCDNERGLLVLYNFMERDAVLVDVDKWNQFRSDYSTITSEVVKEIDQILSKTEEEIVLPVTKIPMKKKKPEIDEDLDDTDD